MSVHVLMASFKKVLCITASLLHLQTIAQSMKMQKKKIVENYATKTLKTI